MSEVNETIERFVDLWRRKRELEAAQKEIAEEIAALDLSLRQTFFEPSGLKSIKTPSATVSIRTDIYAGLRDGVDRDEAAASLKRSKRFGYLVKPNYNSNSLSAAVREYLRRTEDERGDQLLTMTPEERVAALELAVYGRAYANLFKINETQKLTVTQLK